MKKYNISDFKIVIEELNNSFENKQGISEVFDNCDLLLQSLILHFFYSNKNYSMCQFLLNNANNKEILSLFFTVHMDIDLKRAINDPYFTVSFDFVFDEAKFDFVTLWESLVKNSLNNSLDLAKKIETEYYKAVIENSGDFFDNLTKISNKTNSYSLIKGLLSKKDLDGQKKQKIFDSAMRDKDDFMAFDYDTFYKENPEVFSQVIGLFSGVSSQSLHEYFSNESLVGEKKRNVLSIFKKNVSNEKIIKTVQEIENILICNSSSEVELRKVILKLEAIRSRDTSLLFHQLDKSKIYTNMKSKVNVGKENVNKKVLNEILTGEFSEYFDALFFDFALSKEMSENFDKILSIIINNDYDPVIQKKLIITFFVALNEKIKKEKNIECNVSFGTNELNKACLGSYNDEDKKLYLNRTAIYSHNNSIDCLINGVNTIFHELRHAEQYQKELSCDKCDYDIMMRAMDHYLMSNTCVLDNYYYGNYFHISLESDARAQAYVDTFKFFKGYPNLQEKSKLLFEEDTNLLKKRLRSKVSFNLGIDKIHPVIMFFRDEFNTNVDLEPVPDDKMYEYNKVFKKYPSLKQIFEVDKNTGKIEIRSEDYFISNLEKLKAMPKSQKNDDAIYCFESILYDIKIMKFLESIDFEKLKSVSSDAKSSEQATEMVTNAINEVENEIIKNVGEPPVRRTK